jgi:alpha-galactosidase
VFVAFGWSGQWTASVARSAKTKSLDIKGRIPDLEIALEPGEEIEGPTVVFGLYAGDLADGSNRLRRLIREVYTPRLGGEPFLPVALYDHWFNIGNNFDEALLRKLVDVAGAIGEEYFLLDGGWASGGHPAGNGNYTADLVKLPDGLKPVADEVRSKGLGFGLWFEPERVAPNTTLARAHPDWILWKHTSYSESSHNRLAFPSGTGLLDYGRADVREWVKSLLDRHIRDYDLRYVRYDFNLEPLPYWDANDPPGRRGITQLRHIHGLYAVLDWLRARHPHVILEGCASGGNRIDLEMARRFHAFVISDFNADPALLRFHLHGINYFLPGSYHFLAYTLPTPYQQEFKPDDLGFQSLFGGAFGLGGRIDLWPQSMQEMARKHVNAWQRVRRYLVEDYYPLTSQPTDLMSWSGWQFHDPEDQSGFLQTFRTDARDTTRKFYPRGLDSKSSYRIVDVYDGSTWTLSGQQATEAGIEITQREMSSRILTYQKISSAPTERSLPRDIP